jgi:hypothetical protein
MVVSECVCIRSFGGITVAIALKTKWGLNNFVVSSRPAEHYKEWGRILSRRCMSVALISEEPGE